MNREYTPLINTVLFSTLFYFGYYEKIEYFQTIFICATIILIVSSFLLLLPHAIYLQASAPPPRIRFQWYLAIFRITMISLLFVEAQTRGSMCLIVSYLLSTFAVERSLWLAEKARRKKNRRRGC